MAEPLNPELRMMRAATVRGTYDFWKNDHQRALFWSCCFHEWTGSVQLLPMGRWKDVIAAAQAHADAQPAHPPMLGWPAEVADV